MHTVWPHDAMNLRRFSTFPVSIVVDNEGMEWTFAESPTMAVAVLGVAPGLTNPVRWPLGRWKRVHEAVFAAPPARASRARAREDFLRWTGPAWAPPPNPCSHCHGTGRTDGTRSGYQRPAALRPGVLLDANLLALALEAFPERAAVRYVARGDFRSPAKVWSECGRALALVARMRGSTAGMMPLAGAPAPRPPPRHPPRPEVEPAPAPEVEPAPPRRPVPLQGPGDALDPLEEPDPVPDPVPNAALRCPHCGERTLRGGVCYSCDYQA